MIKNDILKGILGILTPSGGDAEEYSKIASIKASIDENSEKTLSLM